MSTVEVIEQIQALSAEERKNVAAFLRQLELEDRPGTASPEVSKDFERVADEVFTNHGELFRKLAQ